MNAAHTRKRLRVGPHRLLNLRKLAVIPLPGPEGGRIDDQCLLSAVVVERNRDNAPVCLTIQPAISSLNKPGPKGEFLKRFPIQQVGVRGSLSI
jgi:hypothetical protein